MKINSLLTMENQLKATELRIGNYIEDNNGFIMHVIGIFKSEIDFEIHCDFNENQGDYFTFSSEEFNPIQLTEDILLRLGFERETEDDKYGRVWINKKFGKFIIRRVNFNRPIIEPVKYGFTLEYSDEEDWVGIVKEIATVHQLQNLFFSLCGEELTFKK